MLFCVGVMRVTTQALFPQNGFLKQLHTSHLRYISHHIAVEKALAAPQVHPP